MAMRNRLLFLFCALVGIAAPAHAGTVFVCDTMVQSVDLFEAKPLYGLDVITEPPALAHPPEQTLARQRLGLLRPVDPTYAGRVLATFETLIASIKLLPNTEIAPQPDSFNQIFPQGCVAREVSIYGKDLGFILDQDLWTRLSTVDQAALLAHEAVYQIEKELFQATHPIVSRKIVEMLFSTQGIHADIWHEIHSFPHLEIVPEGAGTAPSTGADSFGTTHTNTLHTYQIQNTGETASGTVEITLQGINAAQWRITSNTCRDHRLAAHANCKVELTFLAELLGQVAGTYTAELHATGDAGATAAYGLVATTAYTLQLESPFALFGWPRFDGTVLPGSCSKKGDLFFLKTADAPQGTQTQRFHWPAGDSKCPAGQWMIASGGRPGSGLPGAIRECNQESHVWASGSGNLACGTPGSDSFWAASGSLLEGTCDTYLIYIVKPYHCN